MAKSKQQAEGIKDAAAQEEIMPAQAPEAADDDQEEEQEPERLTRPQAANRVVAELDGDETTLRAMAEKADALFVAGGGGKSNYDRMYWEVWRSIETAEALGLVETEEADILVRKVRK